MKPAIFHRMARAELDAAIAWYQTQRGGLGLDFLNAVERAVDRVQRNPRAGQRYKQTDLRSVLVRRFPYVVFYLEQDERIWIAAVAHGSRRPGYWRRRKPE